MSNLAEDKDDWNRLYQLVSQSLVAFGFLFFHFCFLFLGCDVSLLVIVELSVFFRLQHFHFCAIVLFLQLNRSGIQNQWILRTWNLVKSRNQTILDGDEVFLAKTKPVNHIIIYYKSTKCQYHFDKNIWKNENINTMKKVTCIHHLIK